AASFSFFIEYYCQHHDLHSFPTRRSSDLLRPGIFSSTAGPRRLAARRLYRRRSSATAYSTCGERRHSDHHRDRNAHWNDSRPCRSDEHTSELQSLAYLVCRLLLEKKKQTN